MTDTPIAPPLSALPAPETERWRPLRGGVQNLWHYDHATRFVFHRGRLLLRGRNGVGKTKVVELLLPFLLEGRLDPARLDPFRTRARRMRYNLLHPGAAHLTLNVGYAWLEFGRVDPDGGTRFLTLGAGLKAHRSSDGVDVWFFVAEDRRVDADLDLFDGDLRPVGRGPLEEALAEDGQVFTTARDYRTAVNRALFGMPQPQYEALVEAMLRLRQPHLSERLDPAAVAEVLSQSLPPLDAERVREIAEGFERLESHRRELDERRRALHGVEDFLGVYASYAKAVSAARARTLTRAEGRVRGASERISAATDEHGDALARRDELDAERRRLRGDVERAAERVRTLESSDAYHSVQELDRAEDQERRDAELAETVADRAAREGDALGEAEGRRREVADAATDARTQLDERRRAAAGVAADAALADEHDAVDGQLGSLGDDAQDLGPLRGTLEAVHRARSEALAELGGLAEALRRGEEREQRVRERLADAEEDRAEAERRATAADNDHARAVEEYLQRIDAWAAELRELSPADEDLERLQDVEPERAQALARELAEPARGRLAEERTRAAVAVRELEAERATVASERDRLRAATHEPPPTPAWRLADRTGRPGAPLYLLCEFTGALDAPSQANVEAALEAAGLLDAWVTPAGDLLHPGTEDAVLLPSPGPQGQTLADVTRPTPHGGVAAEVIDAVLRSVALAEVDTAAPTRVAPDGRFAIGPVHGTARRPEVLYVGETARAEARARRLEELEGRLDELDGRIHEWETAVARLDERDRRLARELEAFPSAGPVTEARAAAAAAASALRTAAERRDEAATALAEAETASEEARRTLARRADALGLAEHADRLDELARATEAWRGSVQECLASAQVLLERRSRLNEAERALGEAEERARRAAVEADRAARSAAAARERAATLRAMVGATRDEILDELRGAKAERDRLEAARDRAEDERATAAERVGAANTELEAAREAHRAADAERQEATDAFRHLAAAGLLVHVLEHPPAGNPVEWPLGTTLDAARAVGREAPSIPDATDEARHVVERAQNDVARRQHELGRELVSQLRLYGRIDGGLLVHDVQYAGRTFGLIELAAELRDDIADREMRLHTNEQELLEEFLTGELHEHLRARIREADELVGATNTQLASCPTAAGHRVRLRWDVAEEAPAGTREAVDLLLRGAGLLTTEQREALRAFLHERLREAREGDAAASLHERIAGAFDYRGWYAFSVQVQDAEGSGWRKLTKRSHAAGSGGEKAVMLHLPLFAAMAAHYHTNPTAPRLIVLDEVFAGIDRTTRAQLSGLLVDLDLDALLTSHEEWGFYGELDGISTYHLHRDPEVLGVLAEWFVWDGTRRWEMGVA